MAAPVAVVLGTRPEIIKLAAVLDELAERAVFIHTGQHYDHGLSQAFLDGLGLPAPDVLLELGDASRAEQIGRGVSSLGEVIAKINPAAVVVQGDTNSALAGGLAANACRVPLVHVEAGLRSYDRAMPEEHNRVLIDHIADLLAAPTSVAVANLEREGLTGDAVVCTGNTVVEAVHRQLPDEAERAALLDRFGLRPGTFALVTIHRPENTDDRQTLSRILDELAKLPVPALVALHPRTAAAARHWGLDLRREHVTIVEPLSGPQFLGLATDAAFLVTDSGGIQEEATVLAKPIIVVRRSTERPEAFEHHAQLARPEQIGALAAALHADLDAVSGRLGTVPCPYGDGTASARIVAETLRRFG